MLQPRKRAINDLRLRQVWRLIEKNVLRFMRLPFPLWTIVHYALGPIFLNMGWAVAIWQQVLLSQRLVRIPVRGYLDALALVGFRVFSHNLSAILRK